MAGLVLLHWGAFAGTHMSLSHPPIRAKLVERLGEKKFLAVYSLTSLGTFLPLCTTYYRKRMLTPFPNRLATSALALAVSTLLKMMGAVTAGHAFSTPSPTAMPGTTERTISVKGLTRITRHGLFLSTALWGLGNALIAKTLPGLVFWGGFPAFFLGGCMHQDMRQRAVLPKEFYDQTSLLPFQAIYEGRNSLHEALEEMDHMKGTSIGVGLLLFAKVMNTLVK